MDMHDSRRVRSIAATWVVAVLLVVAGEQASVAKQSGNAASQAASTRAVRADGGALTATATPSESEAVVTPPPLVAPARPAVELPADPPTRDWGTPIDKASTLATWSMGLAVFDFLGVLGLLAGCWWLQGRIRELEALRASVQFVDRREMQDLKKELEASLRKSANLTNERMIAELNRHGSELRENAARSRAVAATESPAAARRSPMGAQRPAPAEASLSGIDDFMKGSPSVQPAPAKVYSHPVLIKTILQAIMELANSGTSITAANAATRILSATRDEGTRQYLSTGQFGIDFFDATGQASVQSPELISIRLDSSDNRYVVPFPQAGRSSRFVAWFGPAEYKTNPVLAQQPAVAEMRGNGMLSIRQKGTLVGA